MVTRGITHRCPAPSCTARVPRDKLACLRHWRQVSAQAQREVWLAWNAGDLDRHYDAIVAAVAEMRP